MYLLNGRIHLATNFWLSSLISAIIDVLVVASVNNAGQKQSTDTLIVRGVEAKEIADGLKTKKEVSAMYYHSEYHGQISITAFNVNNLRAREPVEALEALVMVYTLKQEATVTVASCCMFRLKRT